ncbi:tyrosine-type recombinase/integrase [Methylosarcina fibrata]|uniref:tyrosine-type recombinase/integrase n=1 Tax=Methylosarcina fibrata TaxID=105972 RepID=UPI0038B79303
MTTKISGLTVCLSAKYRANLQHDLRHTWASWLVQAGTPLHALQELGGWESVEMVRRYAHFSSDHLADYVERLSGLRAVSDQVDGYDLATGNNQGVKKNNASY